MEEKKGREALLGAEGHVLDLMFEASTSKQWANLLRGPLERAAAKGKRELTQQLVGAGADIGDALHSAIEGGHGEIANDLLEGGASIEGTRSTDGRTPLHTAAYYGETEMVQLLLPRGARKNAFDNERRTPLYSAADQGRLATVQAFLAAGANANLQCGTRKWPVMINVVYRRDVDMLRVLIEHGADLDGVGRGQETALHLAAWSNNTEVIHVLVGAGANIDSRDRKNRTPLHGASVFLKHDAVVSLLALGATVNALTKSLETPLMQAASKTGATRGAADVVGSLLRAGADETLADKHGRKASDEIGRRVQVEGRLMGDVERVRALLANAPADRAWRRRGYLVLCRAHPDRVKNTQLISDIHHTDTIRMTPSGAVVARAAGVEWEATTDETAAGEIWSVVMARVLLLESVVMAKVLLLEQDDIFRAIVGYL